jgi:molybdopterin converting factor small subunit
LIIKVKGYLTYRDVIGKREFELPNDVPISLIEFVKDLAEELGGEPGQALFDQALNTIGPSVAVMHNGRHYNHLPDRLETVLQDQDEIAIFPPGAGG